jgi:hypothetical protein
MYRIISAFRLLMPRRHLRGPLRPSSDGSVSPEVIGDFLNAMYVAVEKLREFGFSDEDFGGDIEIIHRKKGEKANGQYLPKEDKVILFYPTKRGVPDYPWVIIHEVIHRIWVKHLDDDAKGIWSLLCESSGKEIDSSAADAMARIVSKKPEKSSLWFYFTKHFGKDIGSFKQWLTTRKVSYSFPSSYASAEPSEAFSEVAANIILGRGHAGLEIRSSGSMIRKVFLCLVDKLRHKNGVEGRMFEDVFLEHNYQDENFLQTQVDFGYLRVKIPRWVSKNIPQNNILRLEHRPHVTVYYGADKRDIPKIEEVMENYGRPIRAMLGEFDIFEHPEQDVLYIKIIGESFHKLHDKLAGLPNSRPPTKPDYTPHLTVAYLKKGTGRKYVGTTPFRMVVSARGLTIIGANGIEQSIRAVSHPSSQRDPVLLAGL